jgi:hypothetical protein
VYGAPKSGKTQLVSKLTSKYDLLWFDLEQGYTTLLKLPAEQQERIELLKIPDSKSFPIAIETMLKVIVGLSVDVCDLHGKVGCMLCKKDSLPFTTVCLNDLPPTTIVVIDSLTQLANSAMNHITKGKPDDYKVEWDDYRKQGALMEKFLSSIQNAKYSIVCITHEAEIEQEDGRKKLMPVSGTSNFSRNTARYFDDVAYCEVKNKKHVVASATSYSNNILTGSRADVDLSQDVEPDLLKFFEAHSAQNSQVTQSQVATNLLKGIGK